MQLLEKELSWLSFNHRVLQEAQDEEVPLLERFRFLGIYSSNMDEFYRVRVANVRRKVLLSNNPRLKAQSVALFDSIQNKVIDLQTSFDETYQLLLQQLDEQNIHLINEMQLSDSHKIWLDEYYKDKLRRHIFPLILNENVNLADHINDDATYLMVSMTKNSLEQYALVEVPSSNVPRFLILPELESTNDNGDKGTSIILLDNIIRHSLHHIFNGFFEFDSIHAYSMKLTRDAEFDLSNEFSQSLLEQMSSSLKKRVHAEPVRLVYDKKMPKSMLNRLTNYLGITSNHSLISGGRYHSFKDFIEFPSIGDKNLEHEKLPSIEHHHFTRYNNAFTAIKARDILLYYPYHKFSHFTEWLRQSAYDPKVSKIEISLYRVAKKSRIIAALSEAVKNGKEVSVNIELRARFDEQANLQWAEVLSNAGANVTFGIPSLKVHAKICLITRKEEGKRVRYAHIGTGNFHEKNAKIYTDFSLFTCQKEIADEVAQVFEFIKFPYLPFTFKHLMVSPINTRHSLEVLIDAEIEAALRKEVNGITLKVNNLVDQGLINKLYQASNAGVNIKLIVRGVCSLVTGVTNQSENISAISVVDRYLEHPRVAIFQNKGQSKVYLSSADWMTRNIDRRVEVGCPIYDPAVKQNIIDIINIQINDNTKARLLDTEQTNQYQGASFGVKQSIQKTNKHASTVRSQIDIYHYLLDQQREDTLNFSPLKKELVGA
ncbi:polyphosphate kinase 1 [Colwellia echini]|uniref:Polyphosphate kinase n=1 Tax=Colwellia echini TaxID=1982103 RepID=A0ABY3MUC0_9GAMM|nr:polyphosphate kinase 1 [Colwellia echini]TYK64806.1 polyphosphate kinase 1 [Colwellia echini]